MADLSQFPIGPSATHPSIPKDHLRYGRPKKVDPIAPDPFLSWSSSEMSTWGAPDVLEQTPPPFAPDDVAPPGVYWPVAPTYRLVKDHRYRRGWIYLAIYYTLCMEAERRLLSNIESHPNVNPVEYQDNRYIKLPVPGYVEAVPGVPYVVMLDDNPERTMTVACVFTVESLDQYGEDGAKVQDSLRQLLPLVWGTPAQGDREATPALYELDLKRNDRSGEPSEASCRDGSYSIGTTVMDSGNGIVVPAKQQNAEMAQSRIKDVLKLLHVIGHLIMSMTCSREEVEVLEFQAKDDNVFTLGGRRCSCTSCQFNVSSKESGGLLAAAMGHIQRRWHVDDRDAFIRMTIFVLFFRLPPGSDIGDFLLGRPGLIMRFSGDVWALIITFKGNDPHSGNAPTVNPDAKEKWIKDMEPVEQLYNRVGKENRAGFVLYYSAVATSREEPMNYGPLTGFENEGRVVKFPRDKLNIIEDGQHILGTNADFARRIALESVFHLYNRLQTYFINLPDPNAILAALAFIDEDGQVQRLTEGVPFHPVRDAAEVFNLRGRFKYQSQTADLYYLGISRVTMLNARKARDAQDTTEIAIATEELTRIRVGMLHPSRPTGTSNEVSHLVSGGEGAERASEDTDADMLEVPMPLNSPPTSFAEISSSESQESGTSTSTLCKDTSGSAGQLDDINFPDVSTLSIQDGGSVMATDLSGTCVLHLDSEEFTPTRNLLAFPSLPLSSSTIVDIPMRECTPLSLPASAAQPTEPEQSMTSLEVGAQSMEQTEKSLPSFSGIEPQDEAPLMRSPTPVPPETLADTFSSESDAVILQPLVPLCSEGSEVMHTDVQRSTEPADAFPTQTESLRRSLRLRDNVVTGDVSPTRKRKRSDDDDEDQGSENDAEEDYASDSDEEWMDDEYEVEKIVDNRTSKSSDGVEYEEYEVKWLGFAAKHNKWLAEDKLNNASLCLAEFLQIRYGGSQNASTSFRVPRDQPLPVHGTHCIQKLKELLSPDSFERISHDFRKAKEHFSLGAAYKMAKSKDSDIIYAEFQQINADLNKLPQDSQSWTTRSADLAISQVRVAAKCLERSELMGDVYNMASMGMRWQGAQSCLALYRWYTEVGPDLADHLIDIYKCKGNNGPAKLKMAHPQFLPLIERIFQYIESSYDLHRKSIKPGKGKPAKRQKTGDADEMDQKLHSLQTIDCSVFQPLSMANKKIARLRSIVERQSPDPEQQRKLAKNLFLDFMSDVFIMDHVKVLDTAFVKTNHASEGRGNKSNKITWKPEAARARLIARGAIHWCFWTVFGDDSDVWAMLPNASEILASPRKLFNCKLDSDEDLGMRIERQPKRTLKYLLQALEECTDHTDGIPGRFQQLADDSFGVIRQFDKGPQKRSTRSTQTRIGTHRFISRKAAIEAKSPSIEGIELSSVCSDEKSISFALPALLVREAINNERHPTKPPVGNIHIKRLYNALHPISEKTLHEGNIDHFNPIRSRLKMVDLFKHILVTNAPGPDFITTGLGLSNALSFGATGQSWITRQFLSTWWAKPFVSLEDCVAKFTSAERAQKAPGGVTEKGPIFNLHVWGQPAQQFDVHPPLPGRSDGARCTVEEKFAPFFEKSLQDRWEKHWKEDEQGRPRTGDPTWLEQLDWIEREKLLCFGRGSLTALQFANAITILRESPAPPAAHIADWIADNPKKGAITGLQLMGFDLLEKANFPTNWKRMVLYAFSFVYQFLDKHLTHEDKSLLRFDTIFVEQLLCKTSRYNNLFKDKSGGRETLQSVAEKALLMCKTWLAGENLEDTTGQLFPFPLSC